VVTRSVAGAFVDRVARELERPFLVVGHRVSWKAGSASLSLVARTSARPSFRAAEERRKRRVLTSVDRRQ
jgi:hypothetical protein